MFSYVMGQTGRLYVTQVSRYNFVFVDTYHPDTLYMYFEYI